MSEDAHSVRSYTQEELDKMYADTRVDEFGRKKLSDNYTATLLEAALPPGVSKTQDQIYAEEKAKECLRAMNAAVERSFASSDE